MKAPERIVWIDLETTGLEPAGAQILELGMIVTDLQLVEIADFSSVVGINERRLRLLTEPEVLRMHSQSGLLDESLASSLSVQDVEQRACDFLDWICGVERYPSGGQSVSFDRSFLQVHMPRLLGRFSHRSIDVSTLSQLCAAWTPIIYSTRPRPDGDKVQHRALADLRYSIQQLSYYRSTLFPDESLRPPLNL